MNSKPKKHVAIFIGLLLEIPIIAFLALSSYDFVFYIDDYIEWKNFCILLMVMPLVMGLAFDRLVFYPKYYDYKWSKWQNEQERRENKILARRKHMEDLNIPYKTSYKVKCIKANMGKNEVNYEYIYIWKRENDLCFASYDVKANFGVYKISLDNIDYFYRKGDMRIKANIYANGDKIQTGQKVLDNRRTILEFEENNKLQVMIFESLCYDRLLKVIPQKEITSVDKQLTIQENNHDVFSKIEELSKLRHKGILTDEEFNRKKTELLEQI